MKYDVIIIGAGAAGLMCAITASNNGCKTLILDKAQSIGKKIQISGGGRCNFTNIHTSPNNYLSKNPYFCVSALKRYSQFDFINLVEKHNIAYHEKTLGQLFCDQSARQIIDMLIAECENTNVTIQLNSDIDTIKKHHEEFEVSVFNENKTKKTFFSNSLVIATGGISIPKMGATDFGYNIAKQFDINIIEPRPALVPFTLHKDTLIKTQKLSGISLDAIVTCNGVSFREGLLFTHRGLSGPVILQISSYWKNNDVITINMAPDIDIFAKLKDIRKNTPKIEIKKILAEFLPQKLAVFICQETICNSKNSKIADLSNQILQKITNNICNWQVIPSGTEGFHKAEVTVGGINTNEISSKTFESKKISNLYFIGEVIDVTGHLGGFNLQWAWSSGHAAGEYVK